jgi:hypothetical protein
MERTVTAKTLRRRQSDVREAWGGRASCAIATRCRGAACPRIWFVQDLHSLHIGAPPVCTTLSSLQVECPRFAVFAASGPEGSSGTALAPWLSNP